PRLRLRLALPRSQTRLAARVAEPPRAPLGSHCQVHRLASRRASPSLRGRRSARTARFTDSPRLRLRLALPPPFGSSCSGYRFRGRRATGYNRTMPETAAGRVGVVVLLVLLAAVVVVPLLPGDPGAVRLAGVAVLWWFAAGAAPVVATLTACALFRPRGSVAAARANPTASLRAVATWASPVVLTAVAACVFAGAPEAPILVLTVAVAPLLALLAPSADPAPSLNRVAGRAAPRGTHALGRGRVLRRGVARGAPTRRCGHPRRPGGRRASPRRDRRHGRHPTMDRVEPHGLTSRAHLRRGKRLGHRRTSPGAVGDPRFHRAPPRHCAESRYVSGDRRGRREGRAADRHA